MRNFLYVFSAFLVIISCTPKNTMNVSGNIENLRKGILLLQKIEDSTYITIDSIVVNGDASFKFTTVVESPEVYLLTMRFNDSLQTEKKIPFFAEASKINIQSKLENFEFVSTVTGSKNQEKWDEYLQIMKRYDDRNLELIKKQFEAVKANDEVLKNALEVQQEKLINSRYLATVNFSKNHNNFELAPYLMLTEAAEVNIKLQDTVYNNLTPKIKDSKYGKILESFLNEIKSN